MNGFWIYRSKKIFFNLLLKPVCKIFFNFITIQFYYGIVNKREKMESINLSSDWIIFLISEFLYECTVQNCWASCCPFPFVFQETEVADFCAKNLYTQDSQGCERLWFTLWIRIFHNSQINIWALSSHLIASCRHWAGVIYANYQEGLFSFVSLGAVIIRLRFTMTLLDKQH